MICLCFIFQHILHVFPRIVLPIGLWVDHKLWSTSTQYNVPRFLYASLLVDHDLWSTLHALYVTMIF